MSSMRLVALTVIFAQIANLGFSQTLKPVLDLPVAGSTLTPGQQLQDAVNNPANAGVILCLARGTYVLDPTRPAGGRLLLQQGMEIVGENQYVDWDGDGVYDPVSGGSGVAQASDQFTLGDSQTLIDGLAVTAGEQGVVRIGRDNSISRVTVQTVAAVGSSIQINLPSNEGIVSAVVTDNVLQGGRRGIACNNPAGLIDGTTAHAVLKRNIIRNNSNVGFQVQVPNTDRNTWEAVIQYNRIYNNAIGMFLLSNQSAVTETTVVSTKNLIEGNRLGILVIAGQDGGGQRPPGTERGGATNRVNLISHQDRIENNIGNTGIPNLGGNRLGGGVVAMAGCNVSTDISPSVGNDVLIQFLSTRFNNNLWKPEATHPGYVNHFTVFGYWSFQNRTEYGTDNTTRVRVRLANDDNLVYPRPGFWMKHSVPDDPTGTNQAIVFNSDVVFQETDSQGFPGH